MINDFIMQKSDMIDLNTVENVNKLEEITTEIMSSISEDSKTPVKDIIAAIEKYNTDHKLPLDKRIDYWITADGNTYALHVLHAKLHTNYLEVTCRIDTGTVDARFDANSKYGDPKMSNAKQGLFTYCLAYEQLFGVAFGSYNKTVIDPLFENSMGDSTKISNIEIELRKELNYLNSLKSSGKLRDYIIEFNKTMHKPGFNDAKNYNYNREAYNLYTTLWTNYLNLIENIIDNIEADTVKTPEIGLFVDKDGVEDATNYKKILE